MEPTAHPGDTIHRLNYHQLAPESPWHEAPFPVRTSGYWIPCTKPTRVSRSIRWRAAYPSGPGMGAGSYFNPGAETDAPGCIRRAQAALAPRNGWPTHSTSTSRTYRPTGGSSSIWPSARLVASSSGSCRCLAIASRFPSSRQSPTMARPPSRPTDDGWRIRPTRLDAMRCMSRVFRWPEANIRYRRKVGTASLEKEWRRAVLSGSDHVLMAVPVKDDIPLQVGRPAALFLTRLEFLGLQGPLFMAKTTTSRPMGNGFC